MPWLFTILANLCHNWHKSRRAASSLDRESDDGGKLLDTLPSAGTGPESATLDNETVSEVRAAVNALDETYRPVFLLYYFEEFSLAEIARTIGEFGIIRAILCPRSKPASLSLFSQSSARVLSLSHDHQLPFHQMQSAFSLPFQADTNLISSLSRFDPDIINTIPPVLLNVKNNYKTFLRFLRSFIFELKSYWSIFFVLILLWKMPFSFGQ